MNSQDTINQAIGGVVEQRLYALLQAQEALQTAVTSNLADQIAQARLDLGAALNEVEKLRDFIQSPQNILGSMLTKHGEIAEQLEVHIHNARQLVCGQAPTGIIESEFIPRTGPIDYSIDGYNIQSKFCNNARKTFENIKGHLSKYPYYVNQNDLYQMPKDQHEDLMRILRGEPVDGMRSATQFALRKELLKFEEQTGRSFADVVKPSISEYREVQIGKVGETIDGHENDLHEISNKRIDDAFKDAEEKHEQVNHISDPSWSEAAKTAAIGAALGGTIQGGIEIYRKLKAGKKLGDFSKDDWKDVGITFGKGALKGGVSGLSIYGLTRVANCSAPLASAIVSSVISVSSNLVDYKKGKISQSEFIETSYASCYESALCCIGAALGSFVLPPPIGAVVGTLVTQGALKIVELVCDEKGIIKQMENEYNSLKCQLDVKIERYLKPIFDYYNKFNNLVELLTDDDSNLRLTSSIKLCNIVGIPENEIIKSEKELDEYIYS